MRLRDYQEEAVHACFSAIKNKGGRALLRVPTGGGKTVIFSEIVRVVRRHRPDMRVVIVCDRARLVTQAVEKLEAVAPDIVCSVYSAGMGSKRVGGVTVGTIQSMVNAVDLFFNAGLVIFDEAHLMPPHKDSMYSRFIAALPESCRIVGCTATPWRMGDGPIYGEGSVFPELTYEVPIGRLLANGHLVPPVGVSGVGKWDLSGVQINSSGEYIEDSLERKFSNEEANEAVVAAMRNAGFVSEGGFRRKVLVFCISQRHAQDMAAKLSAFGRCEAIVSDLGDSDRDDAIYRDFNAGLVDCICSVNKAGIGVDLPSVDALVLARPTKSSALYIQQVGRGLRPHGDKAECLVLDIAGNADEHGPIDTLKPWRKSRGKLCDDVIVESDDDELSEGVCPECGAPQMVDAQECPSCGYLLRVFRRKLEAHERNIKKKAALLKKDIPSFWRKVVEGSERYSIHEKEGRRMLRVDYDLDGPPWDKSVFVCLEGYEGYAHRKACEWWKAHYAGEFTGIPSTAQQALNMADCLIVPLELEIKENGKYHDIINERMPGKGAPDDEVSF